MERTLIFDGNEKQVFSSGMPEEVVFRFKDTVTAFGGIKRAHIAGKGAVNAGISSLIFEELQRNGISTHFIKKLNRDEMICRKICIIPIEVMVHNYIAGPLASKLGLEEGYKPSVVVYDLRYNNDRLGDPLINDTQAIALGIASKEDLDVIYDTARRINSVLTGFFAKAGLKLVDMKLEFGRAAGGDIIVSDEISPDTCRIWDAATDEKLDKDRFRFDLGCIVASYGKVLDRLSNVKKD